MGAADRNRMLTLCMVLVIMILVNGCASSRHRARPGSPPNPIHTVAVLPIHNYTADMDAPEFIRSALSKMVASKKYSVIPQTEIDQKLRDAMGVTLGGQLDYTNPATGAPSPTLVGQTLEVEGLLYCKLLDCQNLVTGFYNRKKIRVKCSLVNTKTASVFWEKEAEESNSDIRPTADSAVDAAAGRLVVERLKGKNPFQKETDAVIKKLRATVPLATVGEIGGQ